MKNPTKYDTGLGKLVECSISQDELIGLLKHAFREFSTMHAAKGDRFHDVETGVQHILDHLLVILVDDKYLLGASVTEHWASPERILQEEFVLAYGQGTATIKDVAKAYSLIASELDCSRYIVGTLAASTYHDHLALARLYRTAGLEVDYIALRGE